MTARLPSLDAIEAALWRELARAVHDREHGWRTPVLATSAPDGLADARTVVLREVDAPKRRLSIYTDSRAGKAQQLAAQPIGMLVAWSAALGWQLRVRARFELHTDGLDVASHWARLKLSPAAQDYLSPLPPGSAIDGPLPPPARESRHHFAMLTAHVVAIDWLELHAEGHRRAAFDAGGARWLQP